MPSAFKVRFIRILETFSLLAFLGTALFIFGSMNNNSVPLKILFIAVGVEMFLALLIYYFRRKVDYWLLIAGSQKSFKHNAEFISLYDRSPVAYVTINTKGKVENFNQAAVHLFGATSDTMADVNFFRRLIPTEGFGESVFEGKVKSGVILKDKEALLRTAKDDQIWVMLSIYPHSDATLRLISLIDVTEKKKVETAKSEFVALATHQLRTPISAIRWNLELLEKNLKDSVTDSQTRYLGKINRNVQRMISLINDFLNVSKLEMGTFATSVTDLDLEGFFESIKDEFSEKIKEKNLIINTSYNPNKLNIKTDYNLLHIIVSNLVSNAVKYTPSGGSVAISYSQIDNKIKITVSDNGIGIPEKEAKSLFSKFYRASNAQLFHTEGTGLGLYVVKQSVEKLGAEISFESEEGKGTEFKISIPLRS